MGRVRLSLFGNVYVECDGMPVQGFESRKALGLLCYLALHKQPQSRRQVAELFWPEKAEGRAPGNLNRVIHNIKQILPGMLDLTRQTIGLCRNETISIDVDLFEQLYASNDRSALEQAAALYQDELL